MFFKTRGFQLGCAAALGLLVLLIPRPEGTTFKISGDDGRVFFQHIRPYFNEVPGRQDPAGGYIVRSKNPAERNFRGAYLEARAAESKNAKLRIETIDGLSSKAMRFLAVLAVLVVLFVFEPIPLEITAISIGVLLVIMGIYDVKSAWASYMHPVVVFIMACLIFAIALDKAGLTKRLGYFIIEKAGSSIIRFTFILSVGLGICSAVMHDAAACAIGIVTMLPLLRAAGIEPQSRTAKFMMISLPFACSCGGMGTLVGGGRCMVAAAFLKEFTGIEISFFQWAKYALPAALVTVPVSVGMVYLVFRPDVKKYKLPAFDETLGPWSAAEIKTLVIIGLTFLFWLTRGLHGIDYSVTGMMGVAALVVFDILKWDDIHSNLEWGTALFIFGGGIALGLAMSASGAADYFARLFFPLIQGGGWLLLFIGVGIFGALVTNVMANVAAAALILPIVFPMARLEGVNPTVLALCLGMSTSFAMLLVIGCPPNAIAYSYRYFKASDITKAGIFVIPILLGTLVLVASVWWKFLGLV